MTKKNLYILIKKKKRWLKKEVNHPVLTTPIC